MVYLSLGNSADTGLSAWLSALSYETGGRISLEELKRRFRDRFNFTPSLNQFNPHEVGPDTHKAFLLVVLEDGVVSLIH